MSPPILRDYQIACVDALRRRYASGHHAPVLQLATGGRKTLIFGEITRSASRKGRRVLLVTHRRELIRQASAKLDWAGVPHGIIAAGLDPSPAESVQVGSIQTIARWRDAIGDFDLVIFDEAHHCRAETWRVLIAARSDARLLGVTATPARLDGKGLGPAAGGPFNDLVCGPGIAELIKGGFLSRTRCFAPKHRIDLSGVMAYARSRRYRMGWVGGAIANLLIVSRRQLSNSCRGGSWCAHLRAGGQ